MSTMISSPTGNLFELLKDESKPAPKGKQAQGKPAPNAGRRVPTPEERARARQEEEAQRNEQKKMEAALVSQHQEEAVAEGFFVANANSSAKQNQSKLSRSEWEAKKAKGEPLVAEKKEPQQTGKGNRRTENEGPVDTQSHKNPKQFEHHENQRGGRGPKPGREFDRHSQNGMSRRPETKRGGGGKFNIGNATEVIEPVVENTGSWGAGVEEPTQESTGWVQTESTTTTATTAATTEGETPVATPVVAEPEKPDPDDEGYGKKTLDQYEKERAAQAEALAKLVGNVQKRTELEKKIDLSKCIEADKFDNRDELLQQKQKKNKQQSAQPNKTKAKAIDFHELAKEQGVTQQQRVNNRPQGPRPQKLINHGRNNFPSLGEEPSPQKGGNGDGWGNGGQRQGGQGGQGNRPPRQQGQGQGQGQRQGGQGQRNQGQGNQGQGNQGQGNQGQGNQGQGQGQRQGGGRGKNFNNQNRGNGNNNNQTSPQQQQANVNWNQ